MYYKYSKSSGDIKREGASISAQENALQKTVSDVTARIPYYPQRQICLLCHHDLTQSDIFTHRDVSFRHCGTCGHIQTLHDVDETYEREAFKALGYEGIYPALNTDAYNSRCARIYTPKADWIFEALKQNSVDPLALKWCDIGCGAGYFLKSLRDMGCQKIHGVDVDAHNLKIAQEVLGQDVVALNPHSFDQTFTNIDADIYTAFFVLEHIKDTHKAVESLKAKPAGTYFAFSVPVFGFIALFESIIKNHYPRSLDAMMHTQIYTEESLKYFLGSTGYDVVSEWVFGQDMMDIHRFLSHNLSQQYPEKLYSYSIDKIEKLVDVIQSQIDQAHFSDARHILAVKR